MSKTYSARGYGWHRLRSMSTLKPGIRREELGSASDTLSSGPNACPLISTFSKPHSEVASTTHIPALKGSSEKALRCFLVFSSLGFASDNPSSDPNAYPLISTFSKPHSEVTSTTHIPALKGVRERRSAVFWFCSRQKVPRQFLFRHRSSPFIQLSKSCICLRGPSDRIGGCLRRSRIFRRTIAFSHAFSLLRLSQITEPEPEPYPRPPRKRPASNRRFSDVQPLARPRTNTDFTSLICSN